MEKYLFPDRKCIPYGMMNFALIRREDYYYVDKTHFIPLIEQADRFFFFMRPRRFGKSLTLNVLQHYYDVRTKDKFDELFGDLYMIGIMKPWYDNYCFAQECYGDTTMYNSNMVLYFVKNYIMSGRAPRDMVEDNILSIIGYHTAFSFKH